MAAGLSSYPLVYKPLDANTPFEPGNRLVVVINDDFLRRADSGPARDRGLGHAHLTVGCLRLRRLRRNRCIRILTTRAGSDQMLLIDNRPRESPGRFAAR